MNNNESTLIVDYTNNCNLHCVHCYNTKIINEKKQIIDYTILLNILETKKFGHVHFIGGEPLFDVSIFKLIEKIPHNITVSINTNGTNIDKFINEILKSNKITEITVSLDGFTAETNDSVRGQSTFNTVLSNVKMLKNAINITKSKIVLTMAFTLLPSNINSYFNLNESNFDVFDNLLVSTPYWEGRAKENYILSDTEFLDNYIIFFENIHLLKKTFKNVYFDTTPIFYKYLGYETTLNCNKEENSKYINIKNEVYTCGPEYTLEINKKLNSICKNCIYFDECKKCILGLYFDRSIYCEHLINKVNSAFDGTKKYKLKKDIIIKEINNEIHLVNLQAKFQEKIASSTFNQWFEYDNDYYIVKSLNSLQDRLQIFRLIRVGYIE